ncbi:MAG TPA: hypothetical protein LFW21_00105 [Rickettsia endosymbiont of Pyrocoelia pectoralis]|nr:hypothetical protein [Rickettsia endosymbiont of Pyrocoelia pectoralis]
MSFQEDLYEFLDIEQGFAITTVLHIASGEEYVITGIMSEEYLEIDSIIGTQWQKNQATIKSWSGSIDAFWDTEDNEGQGKLVIGNTVEL